ncbi:8104_t:CDS:1, partial [Racocetra fulgida]
DNWTYQQDNNPKHKAKAIMVLLNNRCPSVLDWPSFSSDLNLIENLWAIMKYWVERKLGIVIQKKQIISQEFFKLVIEEKRNNID